jgi:hypothetical protein
MTDGYPAKHMACLPEEEDAHQWESTNDGSTWYPIGESEGLFGEGEVDVDLTQGCPICGAPLSIDD